MSIREELGGTSATPMENASGMRRAFVWLFVGEDLPQGRDLLSVKMMGSPSAILYMVISHWAHILDKVAEDLGFAT